MFDGVGWLNLLVDVAEAHRLGLVLSISHCAGGGRYEAGG